MQRSPDERRRLGLSRTRRVRMRGSSSSTRCSCGAFLLVLAAASSSFVVDSVQAQLDQPQPCIRWAHSSAVGASTSNSSALSTLYIYGGDAKTSTSQTTATRTNALVSLDLSTNWSIANPPLKLVNPDNGNSYDPPQTSLGGMWSNGDGTALYYYGGYFDDDPSVAPDAFNLFEYSIANDSWSALTTTGNDVLRVAEGAAAVVPANVSGSTQPDFFYFGGHEDMYTVQGWSDQVDRVYLNSMIQFDTGSSAWKNQSSFSSSGVTSKNSTAESSPLLRADSTLTYVPGLGTNGQGVLVSIGGGNANQMMDNSILDVYDIGARGWTKQATQGDTIGPRVSHCAVRGSAKVNGVLQHQIFVYGGQASNRTTQILSGQNSDLYILSLPSFTWTFVGSNLPSQPTGRAAHSCTLLGSQMVVVGGYISEDLICEQPGVYVLDTANVKWSTSYTAGTTYTTPNLPAIVALAGGRGTGSSTSGSGFAIGGTGVNDIDTSSQFGSSNTNSTGNGGRSGGTNNGSSPSGRGTSTGAIAGGVVGGIVGGALIAGALFLLWRRRESAKQRTSPSGSGESEKRFASSPTSTSPDNSSAHNPYDEIYAPDNVEEETAGYNAQFSHLVPRQALRVVNA